MLILVFIKDYIPSLNSKCIEGSSHYLGDKQDFEVSSKGPSSGNRLISRRRVFARNVEILFIA